MKFENLDKRVGESIVLDNKPLRIIMFDISLRLAK